MNIRTFK